MYFRQAPDDQLRERMLNIESELRSLRSELEERNRIFKSTPISSQQDKPKTVDKCKDADNEGVIPEQMSLEITKSENQSPLEANLLPENDSDSLVSYEMVNIF